MKKKQTLLFISSVLLFVSGNVLGDLVWDSGHHEYSEGTETFVYMYNDASAEITGGIIHEFYMYNETTAEITGGEISILFGQNISHVNVYDGSTIGLLRPNDTSTSYVYGGEIQTIFTLGSSESNIYGGLIDEIDSVESSIVRLFVNPNYTLDPTGGTFGDGLLSGTWLGTSQSFSINLVGDECIEHLVFIPEPNSIILLLAGIFFSKSSMERNNR